MLVHRAITLALFGMTAGAYGQLGPDAFGKDPKAVAVQLAPGADPWRFAHPNASMLGHVNLRALRQSPLWAEMIKQGPKDAPVGLLETIDEIWMSTPVPPPSKTASVTPKMPEPLMLVTGKFSDPEWRKVLKNQPGISTAKALLIGDLPSANLAKRRMALPSAPTALRKRAATLGTTRDVFFVMDGSAFPSDPQGPAAMLAGVKGMEMGVNLRDDFQSELKLLVSKESADMLLGMFEMMRGQFGKDEPGQKQMAEMAKNIQVDRVEDGISFKFNATAAQIQEAMAARTDTRPSVPLDESTRIRVSEPATLPQPNKGKIVINGLEEGPVEIPFKSGVKK